MMHINNHDVEYFYMVKWCNGKCFGEILIDGDMVIWLNSVAQLCLNGEVTKITMVK